MPSSFERILLCLLLDLRRLLLDNSPDDPRGPRQRWQCPVDGDLGHEAYYSSEREGSAYSCKQLVAVISLLCVGGVEGVMGRGV